MNSCKEFLLDDLQAITAIPVEDFSPGTASWQLAPSIGEYYFSPTLSNAIAIGMQPAETNGALIPIRRLTGKAKDAESDSVAGRLHTVSVSCEVDTRDLSPDDDNCTVLDHLLRLERTPCHLLLTFRGGQQGFVQATQDTYTCEVERDGAKTSVQFKVQCLMGIQMITA